MSATYLDKGKQPLLPTNALITPSASPPAFSPSNPQFRRKSTSRPPPPKRVRTSSTPSTSDPSELNAPSSSSSSSVAQALDTNRDEAWRASSQRLMDVWSQLAERYNVPLDKDDIIDLRTAKLVKDRGVTRRSKRVYRIGYFGDPSSDDGNEEREEDDEIDIVSRPEPQVPIKLEMEKSNRVLSPFTEMNPEDADDLRAFLEEEERRKAVGGVDDEEDEDEIGVETLLAEDLDSDSVEILSLEEDEGSDWVTDDNGEEVRRVKKTIVGTTQRALTPVDSEDEFASWDPDDAAPVHTTTPPPPPRQRSPDMIDLTTPSPPSSRDLPSSRGWSPSRTQADLRSPPSSPLRSEVRMAQSRTGNGQATVSQPPSINPPALFQPLARNSQLQTPPTSSSSNSTPDILEVAERAISRSPSSPSPPPPPRRHPSIRPKASNPTLSLSASRTLRIAPPRRPPSPRQSEFVRPATPHKVISGRVRDATPGPLTGRVPEVVIMRRPSRPSATPVKTRMEPTSANGIEQKCSPVSTPHQRNSVDKGKGKAIAQDFDSSDDEPLPPPRRRAKSLAPPESREPSFTERTSTLTVSSSPVRHSKASKPSNVSLPPNGARKRMRSTTPVSAGSSSDEKPLAKTSGSSRHATSKTPLRPALRTNKNNGKARQEVAGGFWHYHWLSTTFPHFVIHQQISSRPQPTPGLDRVHVPVQHQHLHRQPSHTLSPTHHGQCLRHPIITPIIVVQGLVHHRCSTRSHYHLYRISLKLFSIYLIYFPAVPHHLDILHPIRLTTAKANQRRHFHKHRNANIGAHEESRRVRLAPALHRLLCRLDTTHRATECIRIRSRSTRRGRRRLNLPSRARPYPLRYRLQRHLRHLTTELAANRKAAGFLFALIRRIVPRCGARVLSQSVGRKRKTRTRTIYNSAMTSRRAAAAGKERHSRVGVA